MPYDAEKDLELAISLHERGDLISASKRYQEILRHDPGNPDANHNLGILALETVGLKDALIFFENAVNSNPNVAQYWLTLIDANIKLENFEYANHLLLKANNLFPQNDVISGMKKFLEHQKSSKNQITDIPEYISKKIQKLIREGKVSKAKLEIKKLSKKFNQSYTLLQLSGRLNARLEKFDIAIENYTKSLALNPKNVPSILELSWIYIKNLELDEAISLLKNAISMGLKNEDIFYNLGAAHAGKRDYISAIERYEESKSINASRADVLINLGSCYSEIGDRQRAIQNLELAIDQSDLPFEALYNLANIYSKFGEFDLAKTYYLEALVHAPDNVLAHHSLSSIIDYRDDDSHLKNMLKISKTFELSAEDASILQFSIANAYDRIGEFESAFKHFCNGNELTNKIINFSIEKEQQFHSRLEDLERELNSLEFCPSSNDREICPIFIIGMPRSGTTIIEQTVSSHSQISAAGEQSIMNNFVHLVFNGKIKITDQNLDQFRAAYIKKLKFFADDQTKFVTDKMPANYRYIPLIKKVFPHSKIIHLRRNPMAVCWSIFTKHFANRSISYSYNIDNLVSYFIMYNELMKKYEMNYAQQIYTLNYDDFVDKPEAEIRSLIEFIGVPFEKACLAPHKNKRAVKTASVIQVRSKIYKGSSQHWENYQHYLGGAFDRLTQLS